MLLVRLLYYTYWSYSKSIETIPTCGFNIETVQLAENVSFTIWDVGGGAKNASSVKALLQSSTGNCFHHWCSRFIEIWQSKEIVKVLVRGTNALTGEGIGEALMELSSKIQENQWCCRIASFWICLFLLFALHVYAVISDDKCVCIQMCVSLEINCACTYSVWP